MNSNLNSDQQQALNRELQDLCNEVHRKLRELAEAFEVSNVLLHQVLSGMMPEPEVQQ